MNQPGLKENGIKLITMPSTSKSQQRLMGVAYSVKKGDMQISDVDSNYRDKVKDLVDGMSLEQLKDFAETKHDELPEVAEENISLANIGGIGSIKLPTSTEYGSGDVPAGSGDAKKEYKKKRKKMKKLNLKHTQTFESFVNENYDGTASDFKYDIAMAIEEIGMPEKALKAVRKKGKGFEVRMSSYMSQREAWEKIGELIGAELVEFTPGSINVGIYESVLNEAKRINQKQAEDYLKKLKKKITSIIKAKAAKINGEVRLYVDYSNFKERAALQRAGEDLGLTYHSDGRSTNAPTLDFKRGDAIVGKGGVLGISKNWMAFTKE